MLPSRTSAAATMCIHKGLAAHPARCRFIGYRPGDPTAGQPPPTFPASGVPPPPGGLKTIDLRQMSMAQLHAEAAATQTQDVFAALLPDPPGAWAAWAAAGVQGGETASCKTCPCLPAYSMPAW